MISLLRRNIDEHLALVSTLHELNAEVEAAARAIGASLREGNKLLLCGNGGSAADSQHLAAEMTGRFIKDRRPLAAIALSTDTSALTCIANDYSFDDVFARQLLGIARPGDCLLAISTSGNSKNLLKAAQAASSLGLRILGLLGRDGGAMRPLCDVSIVVPSQSTARIQEAHILIGHTLCGLVETELGLA